MLFGYPVAATSENWLHESLIEAIQAVHNKVDLKEALPEWPNIFPAEHRDKLKNRRGLMVRFEVYRAAVAIITSEERSQILTAMQAQNKIADLLSCNCDCPTILNLPVGVREPVKDLFDFAFGLLTDLGIRHRQYAHIHKGMGARVCPFCGMEEFSAPHAPQEDFDHYLPRSIYPFAAANLRNLAPMGHKCNSGYKRAKDILKTNAGARRRAFDPYGQPQVQLSLNESEINQLVDGPFVRAWHLDVQPQIPEYETWDSVFSIRSRYTQDALEDRNFRDWVWDFTKWFKGRPSPLCDQQLIAVVTDYVDVLAESGFREKAFIKAAVFRFLLTRLIAGCQRVLGLMRDATGMVQPVTLA
jgi:hypothetical protein